MLCRPNYIPDTLIRLAEHSTAAAHLRDQIEAAIIFTGGLRRWPLGNVSSKTEVSDQPFAETLFTVARFAKPDKGIRQTESTHS